MQKKNQINSINVLLFLKNYLEKSDSEVKPLFHVKKLPSGKDSN